MCVLRTRTVCCAVPVRTYRGHDGIYGAQHSTLSRWLRAGLDCRCSSIACFGVTGQNEVKAQALTQRLPSQRRLLPCLTTPTRFVCCLACIWSGAALWQSPLLLPDLTTKVTASARHSMGPGVRGKKGAKVTLALHIYMAGRPGLPFRSFCMQVDKMLCLPGPTFPGRENKKKGRRVRSMDRM